MSVSIPHFSHPFHFGTVADYRGLQAATVEQNTVEEILTCVESVLRYEEGTRPERPDFGIPDQVFSVPGVDEIEILGAVRRLEPRADLLLQQAPDILDPLITRVRVSPSHAQQREQNA